MNINWLYLNQNWDNIHHFIHAIYIMLRSYIF